MSDIYGFSLSLCVAVASDASSFLIIAFETGNEGPHRDLAHPVMSLVTEASSCSFFAFFGLGCEAPGETFLRGAMARYEGIFASNTYNPSWF